MAASLGFALITGYEEVKGSIPVKARGRSDLWEEIHTGDKRLPVYAIFL